jgi:hypothetical protein
VVTENILAANLPADRGRRVRNLRCLVDRDLTSELRVAVIVAEPIE